MWGNDYKRKGRTPEKGDLGKKEEENFSFISSPYNPLFRVSSLSFYSHFPTSSSCSTLSWIWGIFVLSPSCPIIFWSWKKTLESIFTVQANHSTFNVTNIMCGILLMQMWLLYWTLLSSFVVFLGGSVGDGWSRPKEEVAPWALIFVISGKWFKGLPW